MCLGTIQESILVVDCKDTTRPGTYEFILRTRKVSILNL